VDYKPDEFIALLEEVEHQGGALLNDPCEPSYFNLEQPDASGKLKLRKLSTTGCGNDCRMGVPYQPPEGTTGAAFVAACAVDDNMGDWPRFRHAIKRAKIKRMKDKAKKRRRAPGDK